VTSRARLKAACAALLLPLAGPASGFPDAGPRAARTVHFRWRAPAGDLFYNEARVLESVPSTYVAAAGWNRGYFGMQEHSAKDMVIFSVWDSSGAHDSDSAAPDERVEVVYGNPKAAIRRFAGEGTGAQCKYPYAWRAGETYRFLVQAEVNGAKTSYTAWFYLNEAKRWEKLAVFRAATGGGALEGYYSFVEDFRRDGRSPRERRRARFGRGWVRSLAGVWKPIVRARFTVDETPPRNMDASADGASFELATGGDVRNTTRPDEIVSVPKPAQGPPRDLPDAAVR